MNIFDIVISILVLLGGLLLFLIFAFGIITLFSTYTNYFQAKTYQVNLDNFGHEQMLKNLYHDEFEEYFVIDKKGGGVNETN